MLETDPKKIETTLIREAEVLFGTDRAQELSAEITVMSDQLALLRNTPVDLLDEP
jgi:hypothetical protein